MKFMTYLILLGLLAVNSVVLAEGSGETNAQSQDVIVSGTVSSIDPARRLISVAGKTIHMPALGDIPFSRGQSVSVLVTKVKGKYYYIGLNLGNEGG